CANAVTATCRRRAGGRALRDRRGRAEGVERLADERRELADPLLVIGVEVTSCALVAELKETVDPAVLTADARGEPTAHRRMLGLDGCEVPPEWMADDLLLSEPHHLAGRDRHAVQAEAARIHPEVPVALVLLAQAEVLARL